MHGLDSSRPFFYFCSEFFQTIIGALHMFSLSSRNTRRAAFLVLCLSMAALCQSFAYQAKPMPKYSIVFNNTPQTIPFSQTWSDTNLIGTTDDWSGVAGINGYRGDD